MYPCLSGLPLSLSFFVTLRPRAFCEILANYRRSQGRLLAKDGDRFASIKSYIESVNALERFGPNRIVVWMFALDFPNLYPSQKHSSIKFRVFS